MSCAAEVEWPLPGAGKSDKEPSLCVGYVAGLACIGFETEDRKLRLPLEGAHGRLGWLRLLHICRSWRACGMSFSELWAGDLGALPRAFDEMRHNAGSVVPVTVRLYGGAHREDYGNVISFIQENSHFRSQIVKLEVHEGRRDHLSNLLHRLSLNAFPGLLAIAIYGSDTSVNSTEDIPTLTCPRLQRAFMVNPDIALQSFSLVHLNLDGKGSSCRGGQLLSLEKILRMLSACADTLEQLHLNIAYEKINETVNHPLITLSRLQTLQFSNCIPIIRQEEALELFLFIRHPFTTTVQIELDYVETVSELGASRIFGVLLHAGLIEPHGLSINIHAQVPATHAFKFDVQLFNFGNGGSSKLTRTLMLRLGGMVGAKLEDMTRNILHKVPDLFIFLLELRGEYSAVEKEVLASLDGVRWVHYYGAGGEFENMKFIPFKARLAVELQNQGL